MKNLPLPGKVFLCQGGDKIWTSRSWFMFNNKFKYLVLFFLIFLAFNQVEAQRIPAYNIKTNPLPVLWGQVPFTGEYRLVFEKFLPPDQSVWFGVSYIGPSYLLTLFPFYDSVKKYLKITGFRLQGGYKFYFSNKKEPRGFYAGPYVSMYRAWFKDKAFPNRYIQATYYNVNMIFGYQFIALNKLPVDVFAGLGYKYNDLKQENLGSLPWLDRNRPGGLKIYLSINAGIAF